MGFHGEIKKNRDEFVGEISMARKRRRRRMTAGGLLSWAAALAVTALAVYLVLTNYVFVVRSVGVELSGDRYTSQQVVLESGLTLGTRMDRIDQEAIARRLGDTGWLRLEEIRLEYPNRAVLVVAERTPAALVSHVSTMLVTDSDGVLIEQVTGDPGYSNCLYVTDVDVKRAQPGQPLQAATVGKINALVALLKGFEQVPCQSLISWATMENPQNIMMYSTNHVWVEMGGSENIADKLRWTQAVLEDLIARGEKLGTLNVSSGTHADYAPQQ